MKTRYCIFDLDGTLINSLYDLADAMNHALSRCGFPTHDREKYRFMVGSGISVLADRAMVVPGGTDGERKKAVLDAFNEYYGSHYADLTRPYDGIPELLDGLDSRGVGYCVLSNKPDNFTQEIIRRLFPGRKFAAVWGKREDYPRKPDPSSVLAMMSSVGADAEECLYIGDSDVDMQTAANAGLRRIGVSWGFRPVSELISAGADAIADTPHQILELIHNS